MQGEKRRLRKKAVLAVLDLDDQGYGTCGPAVSLRIDVGVKVIEGWRVIYMVPLRVRGRQLFGEEFSENVIIALKQINETHTGLQTDIEGGPHKTRRSQ